MGIYKYFKGDSHDYRIMFQRYESFGAHKLYYLLDHQRWFIELHEYFINFRIELS